MEDSHDAFGVLANLTFGTYTFGVSREDCGDLVEVARHLLQVLREGVTLMRYLRLQKQTGSPILVEGIFWWLGDVHHSSLSGHAILLLDHKGGDITVRLHLVGQQV